MTKTVVVTGAAGYIGGQTALFLKDAGYDVVGVDRKPCPAQLKEAFVKYTQSDIADNVGLSAVVIAQPYAVVHCAGTSLVGPSVANPAEYYDNNMVKTKALVDLLVRSLPRAKFVFSSSASVYGTPFMTPCHEVDPREPISPYGESKFMTEMMLESYHRAYNLNYVAFRYFNACGADSRARHGQELGATHIIARVLEALRDDREFTLNGVDFDTPDGTCIRDYVHVEDIARAHALAISQDVPAGIYNLGNNHGTSNREIIAAAERITGKKLKVVLGDARPGDPAMLTASAAKFGMVAKDWRHYELDDMIRHAWAWYVR
jgi:UDP-glucose 4-epimerase